jgi:hypothetical protein
LKYFLLFVVLLFTSCGVDTSSSSSSKVVNNSSDTTDDTPVVNPIGDSQQTDDTNVSTDVNTTTDVDAIKAKSLFDTADAEYDPNACNGNMYRVASDASYSGQKAGENGSSLFYVNGQGLWIGSEHLEPDPENSKKTWVYIYYKSFPDPNSLGLQGSTSYTMSGVFQISYDIAWGDSSIDGIDNKVYVQSQKGEKPSCYRMYLKETGSQIEVTKVYR